jgi:lipooligosaccharide transport system permease protein
MGLAFTVLIKRIDYFGYYFTFVVNPLFLFGGIFFPYDSLPGWAQSIAWFAPTLHLVDIARHLSVGSDAPSVLSDALWLLVAAAMLLLVPLRMLRVRLVA